MIKDQEYYEALDKRTKEYKEWMESQTIEPHKEAEQSNTVPYDEIVIQEPTWTSTSTQNKPSEGLGDTLEKVFKATKIDRLVKFIAGEDCGCDERKKKLNEMFQYRAKPLCLNEDEYIFLLEFFKSNPTEIKPSEQKVMQKIYERVFNLRMQEFCDGCIKTMVSKMKQVYEAY